MKRFNSTFFFDTLKQQWVFKSLKPEIVQNDFIDVGISEDKVKKVKDGCGFLRIETKDLGTYYTNLQTQEPNRVRKMDRGYPIILYWYRFKINKDQDKLI
jgi:hypothetical protein